MNTAINSIRAKFRCEINSLRNSRGDLAIALSNVLAGLVESDWWRQPAAADILEVANAHYSLTIWFGTEGYALIVNPADEEATEFLKELAAQAQEQLGGPISRLGFLVRPDGYTGLVASVSATEHLQPVRLDTLPVLRLVSSVLNLVEEGQITMGRQPISRP